MVVERSMQRKQRPCSHVYCGERGCSRPTELQGEIHKSVIQSSLDVFGDGKEMGMDAFHKFASHDPWCRMLGVATGDFRAVYDNADIGVCR